ncbi:MAG: hypothetical protein FJ040_10160 [Chloroflexi bacterium]|nr:hypothetical protein [Chloroflexota bacterium]
MKSLWRMWVLIGAVALLSACGSAPAELPQALEKIESPAALSPEASTIIDGWKREARAGMLVGLVKEESIEEIAYQSSSDVAAVAEYYNKLLGADDWFYLSRTPGQQEGFYLAGYSHTNAAIVLGILDLSPYGQSGSYVYLLRGTK